MRSASGLTSGISRKSFQNSRPYVRRKLSAIREAETEAHKNRGLRMVSPSFPFFAADLIDSES